MGGFPFPKSLTESTALLWPLHLNSAVSIPSPAISIPSPAVSIPSVSIKDLSSEFCALEVDKRKECKDWRCKCGRVHRAGFWGMKAGGSTIDDSFMSSR